ncbi:MAG: hypothetical protein C4534_10450 [Gaiellales bacterium]|nr:MAG: hypothetical protein C4534_10450 [Gaiellales bacterium]
MTAPLVACAEPGNDEADDHAAGSAPYGLYAPGTFEQTSFENVDLIYAQLGLESLEQFQDYTLGLIDDLGISWVRIDFYYIDSEFIEYPDYMQKLHDRGISVAGCIRPAFPVATAEMAEFEADVRQLVAEHDDVEVWQMDNEPDLYKYPPAEYVEVFIAMEHAVRDVCPGCRIALAGAAVPFNGGTRDREYFSQVMSGIAARTGESRPFDIVDLHLYGRAGNYVTIPGLMDDYRRLFDANGFDGDISIWFTECATYTGAPSQPPDYPPQTEEEQAAELLKRFATAAAEGAERISWNRFYENHQYGESANGYFDNTGLVYNGLGAEAASGTPAGTKKKAFFAYATLVRKTDGYSLVTRLAPGQFRYEFPDGREPVYLLWAEADAPLPPELGERLSITDFMGQSRETDGIELDSMPIFVENA